MAEDNVYQPGDVVPLEATFKTAAGTLTNTTVTLTIRDPLGVTTTPTPTNPTTGTYHYDLGLAGGSAEGVWEYIFAGTGAVTGAERGTFVVEPVSLLQRLDATALATLADVRAFVFRDVRDSSQDRELVERINEYSRAVYRYTGREWLPQTSSATRSFSYNGSGFLSLAPYEARTVTSVTLYTDEPSSVQVALTVPGGTVEGQWRPFPAGKTEEATYLALELPVLGATPRHIDGDVAFGISGFAFPSFYFRGSTGVDVAGSWGVAATLATVPADVQLAVKIAVKDAFMNPAGFSTGQVNGLSFTEETAPDVPGVSWARNLPYESRALLEPYRRERGYAFA